MIRSFQPVVGQNPRVLILGSMPSVKSLEEHQYYGHPRNQFWPIMFDLLHSDMVHGPEEEEYQKKLELIKAHCIAIWDVLESCDREGSLDSDIKNESPNDIKCFLENHQSVEVVIFNGGKAEASFKKHFRETYKSGEFRFIKMPSTSPAYTMRFDVKLKAWRELLNYIC